MNCAQQQCELIRLVSPNISTWAGKTHWRCAGVQEFEKRRPYDILQSILEEGSAEKLEQFFQAYGPAEVACMCLLLATSSASLVSTVCLPSTQTDLRLMFLLRRKSGRLLQGRRPCSDSCTFQVFVASPAAYVATGCHKLPPFPSLGAPFPSSISGPRPTNALCISVPRILVTLGYAPVYICLHGAVVACR